MKAKNREQKIEVLGFDEVPLDDGWNCGIMGDQEKREAIINLKKMGYITTRMTSRGIVAKLTDDGIAIATQMGWL